MASERAQAVLDIQAAFDTDLADAVFPITLSNYDKETFDPITGKATRTLLETDTSRAIRTSHWQYEVFNSNTEPDDEWLILLQDELDIEPSIGTEVEFESKTSRVVEAKQDPMKITWELRIRY